MSRMDDYNYYRDARTQGPAQKPKLYVWACTECGTLDERCDCDADMVDAEEELPTKWEVCPVCDGHGKHVNPSIDAGGLNPEWADDPDFMQDYMDGHYDQTCNYCRGRTTVEVVDLDKLDPERRAAYERQCQQEDDDRRLQMAELAMGC